MVGSGLAALGVDGSAGKDGLAWLRKARCGRRGLARRGKVGAVVRIPDYQAGWVRFGKACSGMAG